MVSRVVMRADDTGMSAQRVPMRPEPALTSAERLHTERVRAHIQAALDAAGGWLSFERYMDLALYAPGLGYYSAGAHKLGDGGDFTTAPESSRLFGACVAQQCAEVLRELGGGSILELGAGTGRLAVDVLTRLDALGMLPDRYLLLDVSADLRERQQRMLRERLPRLVQRIEWLDAPPGDAMEGVILVNEVLDALPVTRFRWRAAGCEELGVARIADTFAWAARPASAALTTACGRLAGAAVAPWDDGYVSEYCPRLIPWAGEVAQSLRRGAVLWFDYGLPRPQYYLPERHEGTLLCHFRQRALEDPFANPGLQDITAWVDFTAVAEAGDAAGYEVAGFTTQALFLAGLGIDREMQTLAGADDQRFAELAQEARRLMLPGEMGERFKAMAWTRALDRELSGFALQDLRHTL
jgi:SAM-dependent MidA family methyltransferase